MPNNGHDPQVDQLLQLAAHQRHQQEMLAQALQNALQNPHTTKRAEICIVGVGIEGDFGKLMVALPTGERWDIPLNPGALRAIRAGFDEIEKVAGQPAESGG